MCAFFIILLACALAHLLPQVIAMRRPSADSKKDAVLVEPAPLLSSLQAGYQMHNTNNSSDGDCVGRHRDSAATPVSGRFLLRGTTLDVKTTARAVANAKRALAFLKGRREVRKLRNVKFILLKEGHFFGPNDVS